MIVSMTNKINDELVVKVINEYGRLHSLPQNPLAVSDINDAMNTIENRFGLTKNETISVLNRAVKLGLIENIDGIIQLSNPLY
jgi:hypothetical protein